MEMQKLDYKNSTITWYRFGSGPQPVWCFHGYGEAATSFAFLGKHAGDQFSFYAIDLPFHGNTEWKEKDPFTGQDLLQIVELISGSGSKEQAIGNRQMLLLGYSLGGRVALTLFQSMPATIAKIVLLAPDGLKVNFWYWLATKTWLGNKFFAFTMNHPGWFFGFLKLLNKLGFVNASIFKFVNYYIGDKEARRLLYQRWTVLRKLRPGLEQIKSLIRKHDTAVRLIYGKHDRIILSSVGEKFRKGIEKQSIITVMASGHQVLHEKHIGDLLPALLR